MGRIHLLCKQFVGKPAEAKAINHALQKFRNIEKNVNKDNPPIFEVYGKKI
jgi:hypothetical protein